MTEELAKQGLATLQIQDTIATALRALDSLEATAQWLRKSLEVKKVSDATLQRANTIARIISDADRQISLEASTLNGMKSRTESQA